MKRLQKVLLLFLGLFLLCACGSRETDTAKALEQFETATHDMDTDFQTIIKLEKKVQKDWESTISLDDSMQQFKKKNGPIFENLNKRQLAIKQLKKQDKLFRLADRKLATIETPRTKGTSVEDIKGLRLKIQRIHKEYSLFSNAYTDQLDAELNFYTSLSHNDMNFKTFNQSMVKVNKKADKSLSHLKKLQKDMRKLSNPLRRLHDLLVAN
ncbi:YkyA family protein [Atopobacter sp. AH10]|uniref:YkyA family protein n=1 Tax=Atopobacter sp. AH10 TaxID=2315861 RepID=UPI0013146F1E|nr:YkyA family protein [Atopobacter sp. AH10]